MNPSAHGSIDRSESDSTKIENWRWPVPLAEVLSHRHLRVVARGLGRPCLKANLIGADVLGRRSDGSPVVVRKLVGNGLIYFLSDPIEQSDDETDQAVRSRLYELVLADAGKRTGAPFTPLTCEPHDSRILVFRQPTTGGSVFVVANDRPPGGTTTVSVQAGATKVSLGTEDSFPAFLHVAPDGRILAASAAGEVRGDGQILTSGRGLHALLALDRADLRRSESILVAPFEPGERVLTGRGGTWTVLIGDFRGESWHTYEKLAINAGPVSVSLDADRATCLVLMCRPGQDGNWIHTLEAAMTHPDHLAAD